MEDVKAMARAKRGSSKRGRASHSHGKHARGGVVAAAAAPGGDQAALGAAARYRSSLEDVVPSNWERYSDDGGSEDEGATPPLDGEIRPKSKGADYSQLLRSDAPKLFEDLPEPEEMFSMMLEPVLGLWDGDSWLEPPSASEQQAAHDAAALLSLDLGLLGRSLSRLHVAERLMVEKELFPKQEAVKQEIVTLDYPTGSPVSRTENRPQEDKQDNLDKAHSDTEIGNRKVTTSSPGNNGGVNWTDRSGFAAYAAGSLVMSPAKTPGQISGFKGEAPVVMKDTVEQASAADERATFETSAQSPGYRKFVPSAAEADLDELLDMLDNQVGQPFLNSSNLSNGTELVSTPDLSFLSNAYRGGSPVSKVDSLPKEPSRAPAFESGNHYTAPTVAKTDRSQKSKAFSKEDKSVSALCLDDDFDSWLDSM